MTYNFRNLIFEGGGIKGIAYLGAIDVLSQKGILERIERIGGTSAGAINAILVGLDFTPEQTRDILWAMDFNRFMDDDWGVVRDTERLIEHYGWYKGDFFRNWISTLVREKTGNSETTFADIEALKEKKNFKSLYFMGTNLSTQFSEVFSAEHTSRMCVADAVRISMSIPLFFAAKRSLRGDVYVDGGVLDNYPVKLFDRDKYVTPENSFIPEYYARINTDLQEPDRAIASYVFNKETLGFRLDTRDEISVFRDQAEPPHEKIDNFVDYAWSLIGTIMDSQQNSHLHSDDWQRTIYIDTLGVKTTEFNLTDEKKKSLVQSGKDGAEAYFRWFDGAAATPINK